MVRHQDLNADPDHDSEYDASDDEVNDLDEEVRMLQEENQLVGHIEDETTEVQPVVKQGNDDGFVANFTRAMNGPIMALNRAFPLTSDLEIQATLLLHAQDLRSTYTALEAKEAAELSFDEVLDLCLDSQIGMEKLPSTSTTKRPLIQEVEDLDSVSAIPAQGTILNDGASSTSDSSSEDGDSSSEDDDSGYPRMPLQQHAHQSADNDATSSNEDSSSDDDDDDSSSDSDDGLSSESDGSDSDRDSSDAGPFVSGQDGTQRHAQKEASSGSESSVSDDSSELSDIEAEEDGGASVRQVPNEQGRGKLESPASSSGESSSDSSSEDNSSSNSDGDSDSSSDSDSEPEEAPVRPFPVLAKSPSTQATTTTDSSRTLQATGPFSSVAGSGVGRGQGMTKTQKRNARRKEMKRQKQAHEGQQASAPAEDAATADFLARQQALLAAVDAEPEQPVEDFTMSIAEQPEEPENPRVEAASSQKHPNGVNIPDSSNIDTAVSQENQSSEEAAPAQEETPRRRMRMDLSAGKRLLFGALGLKTPKTKADEETLKNDLMKDVRPLKNHRQEEAKADAAKALAITEPEPLDEGNDDADWSDKIRYRAVECCQDNVDLSEPPFPFVQRWDPQQQYKSMRKRKRSSQNFNQGDYYEEESAIHGEQEGVPEESQGQKRAKKGERKGAKHSTVDHVQLDYDDPPAAKRGGSSQITDVDDLPSLPRDVSTLPTLQLGQVKPGMVITWKQLLLSKATNWQPELVPTTGLIVSLENETVLHLILAVRDRENDDKEYDAETGKRIYDRFEMPNDSGDEDEGDDGHRELLWIDLIEPRIVQAEPSTNGFNTPAKPVLGGVEANAGMRGSIRDTEPKLAEESRSMIINEEEQPRQSAESSSIPSGQKGLMLDFAAPSVEAPTNSEESGDKISQAQSVQSQHSLLSSQPGSSSQVRVFPPSSSPNKVFEEDTQGHEATSNVGPRNDTEMNDVPGSEAESAYLDAEPSLESPPLAPTSEDDVQHTPIPSSANIGMAEPSSASSIHSGRQLETGAVDDKLLDDDEIIPDTNQSAHEATPKANIKEPTEMSSKGSSPFFPSLDEIWHSAHTSRQTQSPLKSSQLSALRKVKGKRHDVEYETAMQKLDEGDESDSLPDVKNKSIRNLFPNATQPSPSVDDESPPIKRERSRVRPSAPFQIPEGSQVIALSSSSPSSPVFPENYAEDSVDDTYVGNDDDDGSSSLPHGSGWATKLKAPKVASARKDSRARGKSMPATNVASTAAISRPKGSSLSASTAFKNRRKSGRKF